MTLHIRITNESAGSSFQGRVRIFDIGLDGKEYEAVVQERILFVGESVDYWIHGKRNIRVEEVPAPPIDQLAKAA